MTGMNSRWTMTKPDPDNRNTLIVSREMYRYLQSPTGRHHMSQTGIKLATFEPLGMRLPRLLKPKDGAICYRAIAGEMVLCEYMAGEWSPMPEPKDEEVK